jgi:thiol-disulfide isomerase/thioredoxin
MTNSRFAAAGVVLLLVIGGTSLAACSSNEDPPGSQTAESQTTGAQTTGSQTTGSQTTEPQASDAMAGSETAGSFVDYSPELVSSTPGEKLLFFHAPWCPQCQELEADIEEAGVPDGVTVFKVDYDSNQDLREKYGVTIQTTVVKVDDQGEAIESYVAYEEPTFENVSDALLK